MRVKKKIAKNIARRIHAFDQPNGAPIFLTGFQETMLVFLLLNGPSNTATIANKCRTTGNDKTRKRETLRYLQYMKNCHLMTSFERPFHDGGYIWYVSALGEEVACHLLEDDDARIGIQTDFLKSGKHRFCPVMRSG